MQTNRISRRALLLVGGIPLAGVLASGRARASAVPAGGSKGVRFGVRTPLPEGSIRDHALLLKELGYEGLELGPEWLDRPVDSIQKDLEGTGIAVSAIVGSLELLNTDPLKRAGAIELDRRRLQMAKDLKAGFLIEVPIFGPNRFQDLSPIMTSRQIEDKLLVAGLKQLAGDVARTGVTVLLEPLARKETHYMNLQSQGAEILNSVGAPGFELLSDFYHMQLEEPDIAATLAQYGKYTGYVHLADGRKRTEPGSLPFDYRPGFRALKKWGYSGWLVVESEATDEPRAALGRALKYLQRQWSEA